MCAPQAGHDCISARQEVPFESFIVGNRPEATPRCLGALPSECGWCPRTNAIPALTRRRGGATLCRYGRACVGEQSRYPQAALPRPGGDACLQSAVASLALPRRLVRVSLL